MNEVVTYRVADFLLFSREVLFGLFETYNRAIWPLQLVWVLLAAALVPLALRAGPRGSRVAWGIVASAWLFVGVVFQLNHFVSINWAAKYFGWLFLAEGALLFGFGVLGGKLTFGRPVSRIGLALLIAAAFVPWGLLLGQAPAELMLFGWGPDSTALTTIAILLLAKGRARWLLLAPAVAWCAIAGLMYYGLK
jgi:hypothetical protein